MRARVASLIQCRIEPFPFGAGCRFPSADARSPGASAAPAPLESVCGSRRSTGGASRPCTPPERPDCRGPAEGVPVLSVVASPVRERQTSGRHPRRDGPAEPPGGRALMARVPVRQGPQYEHCGLASDQPVFLIPEAPVAAVSEPSGLSPSGARSAGFQPASRSEAKRTLPTKKKGVPSAGAIREEAAICGFAPLARSDAGQRPALRGDTSSSRSGSPQLAVPALNPRVARILDPPPGGSMRNPR